jgi:hypothetical protein
MGKLVIVTAQGYSKEEALASANLNLDVKFDATVAWKNQGQPQAKHLEAFADDYISGKVKGAAGIGFSITVDPGVSDTRERPYKVDSVVTDGARKYKTVYEGFAGNQLVFTRDLKSEAEEAAKEYVSTYKTDVTVRIAKNVVEGQSEAMTVKYTPSVNTNKGTYVFFGIQA